MGGHTHTHIHTYRSACLHAAGTRRWACGPHLHTYMPLAQPLCIFLCRLVCVCVCAYVCVCVCVYAPRTLPLKACRDRPSNTTVANAINMRLHTGPYDVWSINTCSTNVRRSAQVCVQGVSKQYKPRLWCLPSLCVLPACLCLPAICAVAATACRLPWPCLAGDNGSIRAASSNKQVAYLLEHSHVV